MPLPGEPRQLPLDLGHAPGQSRDELIVSDANRAAVAYIDSWPDWPLPVTLLAGPAGSGKTHLAAIWSARAGAVAVDASAIGRRMTDDVVAGAVVVDDADAADLDENGLFHLINAVRAGGGSLLLTARRFPASWNLRLPDLASRLKAATTVEILEPDDALLSGVITKLFADRQVEVDPLVVQFLGRRIERSLSTAIDVVERLDRAALGGKGRITRALAAATLTAMDQGQPDFDL